MVRTIAKKRTVAMPKKGTSAVDGLVMAVVSSVALSGFAGSSIAAEQAKRQVDAHVHGHGKVNIAIEKSTVALELEVPGADIVGFEYQAKSKADKDRVEAAHKLLEDGQALFAPNSQAGCRLVDAKVVKHSDAHDHDDGTARKADQEHHKHDEHKEHNDHKSHDHDEEHASGHHDEKAAHSEFHARYKFDCAEPGKLKSIRFTFFSKFPNSKELEVTVVGGSGQSAFEVTPKNPEIGLSGII